MEEQQIRFKPDGFLWRFKEGKVWDGKEWQEFTIVIGKDTRAKQTTATE